LEVVEQFLRLPRVFAGDLVDGAQDIESAQGDVAEVADGGCDEVEGGDQGLASVRRFPSLRMETWATLRVPAIPGLKCETAGTRVVLGLRRHGGG
jgi:hypothetical protein